MSEWQDISTAPQDGSNIDVWCVDPTGEFYPELGGIRLTDVSWWSPTDYVPHTGWARLLDDGNLDFVEMGPGGLGGLPPWKPTHWKPFPSPPGEES